MLDFSRYIFIFFLIVAHYCPGVYAQSTVKGVVWNPPARLENAAQDLLRMKAMGVEAARIPLTQNQELYKLADSLDIALYQDLPFEHLTGKELVQVRDSAKQMLDSALRAASLFSSARHFGLTRYSDTGSPESCAFLEELVAFAKSKYGNHNSFYYATLFIEEEQCTQSVDLVLINGLDESNITDVNNRWHNLYPDIPMGYSAIGTWVLTPFEGENQTYGYLNEHSEEYQARFLETQLNALLYDDASTQPSVLFVYRWRDTRLRYPSPAHNLVQPYRHTYGLLSSGYQSRVAYNIVEGLYTGQQRVFALQPGQSVNQNNEWVILFIWINLFILSVSFAYFPRFRLMVRRYFTAHGFYREAVREGRELLLGPNILLFAVFSSAFGICSIVILEVFRATEVFSMLVRWAPESVRFTMVALLGQPVLLIIVLSGCYGLLLSFWTSTLSALSAGSRHSLLPGQSFMLVTWPQWPLILVMIAAGVIKTLEQPYLTSFTLVLAVVLLALVLWSTIKALQDYWFVSRVNPTRLALSIFTNPIYLILIAGIYFCIKYADKLAFISKLIASV